MYSLAEAVPSDLPAVRALLRRYARALAFDLAYQRFDEELEALPRPYVRPAGLLLVARQPDAIVGVAAYRPLGGGIAEVKRMYVAPEVQGQGLGRALLERLIAEATAAGHAALRLDTHRPTMAAAIGLYTALGFEEIPAYGPGPTGEIAFFQRTLAADRA